ncbi:hypothetical protein tb265_15320 [Gemmatimonadetes bacterium T265]|nr:hypothetical protein tb265_15320 [Gemmatimonadetes bacterium T265]
MTKLFGTLGACAGSSAGWALGEGAGIFAAFLLSVVGTGVGLYLGRRAAASLGC